MNFFIVGTERQSTAVVTTKKGQPLFFLPVVLFFLIIAYVFSQKKDKVEDLTVLDARFAGEYITKVFGDCGLDEGCLRATFIKNYGPPTSDDLSKLTKVLTSPDALTSDIDLLRWALEMIERAPEDVSREIKRKLCEQIPTLCRSIKNQNTPEEDTSEDVLNTDINDLPLSLRVYNILKKRNIRTLGEIKTKFEDGTLKEIKGFGPNCVREAQELLEEYGVYRK